MAAEDDLCRLWASRALPAGALVTTGGERLEVIYPGRRSGTGGPDFQGALLAGADGCVRAGDVEVHLRSGDWIAHGHRADPAYNHVVLHVVLEDAGQPCLRADGTPVPVLAVAAAITAPLTSTRTAGANPFDERREPCRVAPALPTSDVRAIVRAAGRRRLEEKAALLEGQIVALGVEQALFAALLDAAGYSRNRVPCALLAERLPVERLRELLAGKPPERAEAIASAVLLGLAGLLRAGAPDDPGDPDDLAGLWGRYGSLWPLPPLHPDRWVRAGVRPANRPEPRLHGVATLVARSARDGLARALLAPLRAGDAAGLLARLEVPARQGEKTPPIGPARAVEMAVNVAAPFALAVARSWSERELEDGAWLTVEALPGGEDAAPRRHMLALLKGSGHLLRAPNALESQGLLHLYRAHCGVRACWECPLGAGTGGEADARTSSTR